MHSLAIVVAFLFFFSFHVAAYKRPASSYFVQPKPNEYRHWLPDRPGHGHFHGKNPGKHPWRPQHHPPPHYPAHPKCEASHPSPQEEFWLPKFPGVLEGTSPFLANGSNYQVFRNVKDFGAIGDGVTDDTTAINKAITYGSRRSGGQGPGGTTGQPALIYIPPGEYLISSKIQMFIDTQIIGDAIQLPTLKAASNVTNGTIILNGYDSVQPSTTNFYIGIRNLNLDTTAAKPNITVFALNWAVSQATSLINTNFILAPDSNHIGVEMDGGDSGGGSGLSMGDLTFTGGLIGIRFNNQQYSIKNVKFTNVATGIAIQHAFVITLQQIQCQNVGICVDMGTADVSGSMSLIDSSCDSCGVVVNGSSSILLENVDVTNSGVTLRVDHTNRLMTSLVGRTYVQGHVYRSINGSVIASNGTFLPYTERGNLIVIDGSGQYFTKPQPQYTDYSVSAFASVKDAGATGDGQNDDTAAIQAALTANANCKITYFPHGVYIVTDTLYIPPGSRIVGEVWSTISASGAKFADADNPHIMIQVGKEGEVGVAEFTDMLFTVADVLPGAILVEVNMKGASQGDVSFHNTHYRIGGAADSKTETSCTTTSQPCKAAFLLTHLTAGSSSYIENAWLWSADHDLDGENNQQIGTGRGMLVESQQATWLIGTGSEHHTLYAYEMNNAQNVFAALLQVETPYWQPSPEAPNPWTPLPEWSDPTLAGCSRNVSQCYMQWALRIIGSETHTLPLYGQGFWVFFNGPDYGACTGPQGFCQINIVDIEDVRPGSGIELYNLNTRGVQNMVTVGGSGGIKAATQNANPGSWGGVVAAYLGFE